MARSLGQFAASLLEGLQLRLDLFSVELREEKERLIGLLLVAMLTAMSAFMAFVVLNVAILIVARDHQVAVLLAMLGFYALLAASLAFALWRKVRSAPSPFEATLEELRKDQALLSKR